ncbi:MAG: ribokinase [Alphaproteobacteria bacterium]|jgi:ribokinase|nr:ribokinase [Alphaproteobacteria bacterium]
MILVFGSLNMDLVVRVPVLPKPGETVLCTDYVTKTGGKGGNQAIAAARAGAEVVMVGCVGDDPFGRQLTEVLRVEGIRTEGVRVTDRPSGMAYICVDDRGENFIVVAGGANRGLTAAQVPESCLGFGAATVLLQMEVPAEESWALVRHAHEVGARIMLNVAPAHDVPPPVFDLVDVLVVNAVEARPMARDLGYAGDDPPNLARHLAGPHGRTAVVTLGREGAIAAHRDTLWRVGSLPVEPVDTTGAGDSFTGVLAASLDADYTLPQALHRASVAAGLACQSLGAQESIPDASAIDAHMGDLAPPERLPL